MDFHKYIGCDKGSNQGASHNQKADSALLYWYLNQTKLLIEFAGNEEVGNRGYNIKNCENK